MEQTIPKSLTTYQVTEARQGDGYLLLTNCHGLKRLQYYEAYPSIIIKILEAMGYIRA